MRAVNLYFVIRSLFLVCENRFTLSSPTKTYIRLHFLLFRNTSHFPCQTLAHYLLFLQNLHIQCGIYQTPDASQSSSSIHTCAPQRFLLHVVKEAHHITSHGGRCIHEHHFHVFLVVHLARLLGIHFFGHLLRLLLGQGLRQV